MTNLPLNSDGVPETEPTVAVDPAKAVIYLDRPAMVALVTDLMSRAGNRAFGVNFTKVDGSLRPATVLPKGGRKELVGKERAPTPGLVPYYDWRTHGAPLKTADGQPVYNKAGERQFKTGAWRSFYIAKVSEVRADGRVYRLEDKVVVDFIG